MRQDRLDSRYVLLACLLSVAFALTMLNPLSKTRSWAQDTPTADEDDAGPTPAITDGSSSGRGDTESGSSTRATNDGPDKLSLLWLILKGGPLMIPIGVMSIFAVAMAIERFISLRREKVIPPGLIQALGAASADPRSFDPRHVYRICQHYPSATATVIRAMLLKVGRPHAEVEHAVAEASEREATRLYGNVRWLNLVAAISPLLGLLGTVWGMIRAFFDTTQLQAGQNKADFLASGIYVALVTTLGGLAVAIPAAIFAHFFEGRIQVLFRRIDELLFNLLPLVERYEGRLRVSRQSLDEGEDVGKAPIPETAHHTSSAARAAPQ